MSESRFKAKGIDIIFDDVVIESKEQSWSQICQSCIDKHKLKKGRYKNYSIDDHGSGICGVEGCENGIETDEETFYIDFNNECLTKIEE